MRRVSLAVLPLLPLAGGWLAASLTWQSDPYPEGAHANGDAVMAEVVALVNDVGPRPGGSDAARLATEWVVARLQSDGIPFVAVDGTYGEAREAWRKLGAQPAWMSRDDDELPLRNRLVQFPLDGEPELSGHVLIMGHTDSVTRAPGAEDNASAVAVCLDLCRFLKQHPPKRKVTVAFTDGEEDGLLGAAIIAHRMKPEEVQELSLAFAVEMCGWNTTPYLHWFVNRWTFDWRPPPPDAILEGILSTGTEAGAFGQVDPYVGWLFPALRDQIAINNDADHRPFEMLGRPAVMMTTSSLSQFYPWYHTKGDTPDKLSAETLGKSANALRAATHALGSAPEIGVDSGTYGYPLFGRVIGGWFMRTAFLIAAIAFFISGGIAGLAGAAAFALLTVLSPPSLLATGVAIPACVLALFARAAHALWARSLFGFLSMLPLFVSAAMYFVARSKFGEETALNLRFFETLAVMVALLAGLSFVKTARRGVFDDSEDVEPEEEEKSLPVISTAGM